MDLHHPLLSIRDASAEELKTFFFGELRSEYHQDTLIIIENLIFKITLNDSGIAILVWIDDDDDVYTYKLVSIPARDGAINIGTDEHMGATRDFSLKYFARPQDAFDAILNFSKSGIFSDSLNYIWEKTMKIKPEINSEFIEDVDPDSDMPFNF